MKRGGTIGTTIGILLLASTTFASLYFTARFAQAQDEAFYRSVTVLDTLMERAYGVSSPAP